MQARVLRLRWKDPQITWRVILFVIVLVMDDLSFAERSSKFLLCHNAMGVATADFRI